MNKMMNEFLKRFWNKKVDIIFLFLLKVQHTKSFLGHYIYICISSTILRTLFARNNLTSTEKKFPKGQYRNF